MIFINLNYFINLQMNLRNSPLAKSPPKMAYIPGVTNIAAENGVKLSPVKNGGKKGKNALPF